MPAARLCPDDRPIVRNHDFARLERGDQKFANPGQKDLALDGTVKQTWRTDAPVAKSGDEGQGLPAPERGLALDPCATGTPSPKWRHTARPAKPGHPPHPELTATPNRLFSSTVTNVHSNFTWLGLNDAREEAFAG